jgi:hypothetical protein
MTVLSTQVRVTLLLCDTLHAHWPHSTVGAPTNACISVPQLMLFCHPIILGQRESPLLSASAGLASVRPTSQSLPLLLCALLGVHRPDARPHSVPCFGKLLCPLPSVWLGPSRILQICSFISYIYCLMTLSLHCRCDKHCTMTPLPLSTTSAGRGS